MHEFDFLLTPIYILLGFINVPHPAHTFTSMTFAKPYLTSRTSPVRMEPLVEKMIQQHNDVLLKESPACPEVFYSSYTTAAYQRGLD